MAQSAALADSHHAVMFKLPIHELTVQVVKTDRYSFACGGCADIYKTEYKGCPVAVKVFKVPQDRDTFNRRLCREVRVWSKVKHPYILPLLGICYDFDRPNTPCLVSPYYHHGHIIDYLMKHPYADKFLLLNQIALALSYLHGQSVIHGDIKGRNILINDDGEAIISDYGLSRILDGSGFTTKLQSATWRYMAPELLFASEDDEYSPRVSMATDVWSFSMTIIEILTESLPFSDIKRDANVIRYLMSGGHPRRESCPQIDDDVWAMLESCWDVGPNRRPPMVTLSQFFALRVAADKLNVL